MDQPADQIAPGPILRLAACLGLSGPVGAVLPPAWHWLFFLDAVPQDALGIDGHRARGGLIAHDPAFSARMWAGGRLRFHKPVPLGAAVRRESSVLHVRERAGRSGLLRFVTLRHRIASDAGLLVEEEQDIVLRAGPRGHAPAGPIPLLPQAAVLRTLTPDEVMLFRFSALTFNAHRIHYDAPYATSVENYPGLVVHGPLQAILLAGHAGACVPAARMIRFDFRAASPAFCGRPLQLACWADPARPNVWHAQSRDCDGVICMTAEAGFSADGGIG
jgi:3-methylfumaryl-CoA hydratase